MIKILDILKEITQPSPPDVLYHFTTPENFVKILNSDKLKAHPKFNQISFTEDPDLWAFQEFPDSNQEIGFRMAFETDSLPPVKPFTFQGAPGESLEHEKEWRTTTGDVVFSPNIEDQILNGSIVITAQEYWKDWLRTNMKGPLQSIYNKINWV